nr:hypothetical protein [Tanacetum cinerariifolium]
LDDDNDDVEKDDKDGDADDEGDDHVSDTQDADEEENETESDEDEMYKYKIRVRKDEDVEMKDAEVDDSDKVSTVKDFIDTYVSSLLDIHIQKETPQTYCTKVTPIILTVKQTPTPILTPPIITDALTVTTAVLESNALTSVELRVEKLEKDVSEFKTVNHSSKALVVLQSYVLKIIDSYLDTKVGDVFQKELQKHTADLIHKFSL